MNCPACGVPTSVYDTTDVTVGRAEIRVRKRECRCGRKYESQEKITRWLNPICSQMSTDLDRHRQMSIVGSVSDPVRLALSCVTDPDPPSEALQVVDPARVKAKRGRGDAKEYHPEFERLWEGCAGRRGNKFPAFKAWLKFKPPLDLTLARFALWATTSDWLAGFAPHFSSWLAAKGWESEPGTAEFKPRNGTATKPTEKSWLERQNRAAIEEAMKLP